MTDHYTQLKSWNEMTKILEGIPDIKLRKLYHDALVLRAIDEWGFNPDTLKQEPLREEVVLNAWEKRLLERIRVMQEYGIDPATKEEKEQAERELKEAKLRMYEFIKEGGTLSEIPPEIRTDEIVDLYLETLKKVYDV